MENIYLVDELEARTGFKFEQLAGRLYARESDRPLDDSAPNLILAPDFDRLQFYLQNRDIMAASLNHAEILRQLNILIVQRIDLSEYAHYVDSIRINRSIIGYFLQPDLVIVLEKEKVISPKSEMANPHTIVEILSPSTEKKDKTEKKKVYQNIDSLQEYLLIAQNEYRIEQFLRKNKTNWTVKVYDSEDQTLVMTVGVKIKLKDLYKNTDWATQNP